MPGAVVAHGDRGIGRDAHAGQRASSIKQGLRGRFQNQATTDTNLEPAAAARGDDDLDRGDDHDVTFRNR